MDKKLFGVKLGTYVAAFICLIVAFVIWIYVKYDKVVSDNPDVNQSDIAEEN